MSWCSCSHLSTKPAAWTDRHNMGKQEARLWSGFVPDQSLLPALPVDSDSYFSQSSIDLSAISLFRDIYSCWIGSFILYRRIRNKDVRSSAFRVAYQAVSSVAAAQKSQRPGLCDCPKGSLHKGMSSKEGIAMSAGRSRAPTKS